MKHLDSDIEVAIKRLRYILQKRNIKFGVFNYGIEKSATVKSFTVDKMVDDGMYSETTSNIAMSISYITSRTNIVGQPECPQQTMNLIVLPAIRDTTLPEMLEVKLFGVEGKPSTVAIDKESGDIYLVYVRESEILFSHFAKLSDMDREFITSDTNVSVLYEFGVYKDALYRFITRDIGYSNLKEEMYIQFCLSPIVRVKVGSDGGVDA